MDNLKSSRYSETEQRIFRAAIGVFSREGLKGARMQEVADQAGLNKALVHYYFRSKERLYEAVFEYIVRQYFSSIHAMITRNTPPSRTLRNFIDGYIDLLRANPHLVSFMAREISLGAPVMKKTMARVLSEAGAEGPGLIVRRIEDWRKSGGLRQVDPIQLIATLIGACLIPFLNFPLLAVIDPTLEGRREEFFERRKRHVYDVIYNGIRKR